MKRDVRPAATVRSTPQSTTLRPVPPRAAGGRSVVSPATGPSKPYIPAKPKSYRRDPPQSPEEMVLVIEGQPVSKERPRTGKGGHFYTPRKTTDAEEVVKWHAKMAGARVDRHSLFSVDFVFFCAGNRKRDNDNMQKLVQDALNKIVWWDDSQIRHSTVEVLYGSPHPRSVITVRRIES